MTTAILEQVTTDNPRIERGMDLLDRACPGWEHGINLDALSMMDGNECVVGQLFGHYKVGKETLGISSGVVYGFVEPTKQWRAAIKERLGQ